MMKSIIVVFNFYLVLFIITLFASEIGVSEDFKITYIIYAKELTHVYNEANKLDKIIEEGIIFSKNIETIKNFLPTKVKSKMVTVTAYNNLESQCDSTPNICAWGDRIKPGIIAVSRNLIPEGLGRNTKVFIEGLGTFTVLDKMNKRYHDRIDIFVGKNINISRKFGVKEMKIFWL